MNKLTLGLFGLGNVGSGVIKFLKRHKAYIKRKHNAEIVIKTICDRSIDKKKSTAPSGVKLTKNINDIINDPEIDALVELIGGMNPAKDVTIKALQNDKHVVTANKELIANAGYELFQIAQENNRHIYFESSVGAGIPIIKTLSEGIAGNQFNRVYGIINGTCNYILSEMTEKNYNFKQALEDAQKKGFAEPDPTYDINGMDSAHKLAILVHLAFGKVLKVKEVHTEGITHISHADIDYAESLDLKIKLLAIAKRDDNEIEARVHPTLISKYHPLASVNGICNAIFLDSSPLGDVLLSGEGAGQMAAASGVVSDLINISARNRHESSTVLSNIVQNNPDRTLKSIDSIKTRFYIRFMATDKPGVLSKITGVLGEHGIGINSVSQKAHNRAATVPVIMLTEYAQEKQVRLALAEIHKLSVVKAKPVAIRMEKLQ